MEQNWFIAFLPLHKLVGCSRLPKSKQISLCKVSNHGLLHTLVYYSLERVSRRQQGDKGGGKDDGNFLTARKDEVVQEPEEAMPVPTTMRGFCKSRFSKDPKHSLRNN